jgi:glycogen operon protein
MHVDGFRFDLASALARGSHDAESPGAFFHAIHQDPVLSQVKLIAEPWDLGEGGYRLGRFPVLWAEWNDQYRDTARRFWRGDEGEVRNLGLRLTGSSDLFRDGGRGPWASLNFVTSHDGFTLHDLVSYSAKHNEANGEENQDGTDHNLSWNCGIEGPTDDPAIRGLRERQKRNFLATLLLSQGVPMLCGGDEIGRTQQGNNNAYCQDNELSWLDWTLDQDRLDLLAFTRDLIALRRRHRALRRRFFPDRVSWLQPDGTEMTEEDWNTPHTRCLGLWLPGDAMEEADALLLLLNASETPVPFVLPARPGSAWEPLLDTCATDGRRVRSPLRDGEPYDLEGRSVALLRGLAP